MKEVVVTSHNDVVLITGGSDGIGFALATRFLAAGATVLVTGRDAQKLNAARERAPGLRTFVNDVSNPEERTRLAEHARNTFPGLNIIINNAGVQRRIPLATDNAPWYERQAEIDTLLCGPVHLNSLLVPTLLSTGRKSFVVNVTSGGAYFPQPFAPVYSACKAALHSYTVNLRYALQDTDVRVVELVPPAVKTNLGPSGTGHGADLEEFADKVFPELLSGVDVVGFGPTDSEKFHELVATTDQLFASTATRFPIQKYSPTNV